MPAMHKAQAPSRMEIPHQPSIASFYQQSIARFEGICRFLETPGYQKSHKDMFSLLSDELGLAIVEHIACQAADFHWITV